MKSVFYLLLLTLPVFALVPPRPPHTGLPNDILLQIRENPSCYSKPYKAFPATPAAIAGNKANVTDNAGARQLNIPVFCAKYADVASGPWDVDLLQQKLFGQWETGSMRDFFLENSYQMLELQGTVYNWVQVSENSDFYDRINLHTGELLTDVFDQFDETVDFSQYDNDGPDNIPNSGDDDGYVDVAIVVHSGYGAEETGGPEIWSNFSRFSYLCNGGPYETNDISINGKPVYIEDCAIVPAQQKEGMVEIGVFCHELGHALGLPDLYDRDYSSMGVGNWCLMAGGAWGGDYHSPQSPSHFSAWCKERLGWLEPIVLTDNQYDVSIPPIEKQAVAYKLWGHGVFDTVDYENYFGYAATVDREYFIIENRAQTGFDQNLPGNGLLVWHVDHSVSDNTGNDDEWCKLVDLEAADGENDLDLALNHGDAGDPFPGLAGNIAFNRYSRPNSLNNEQETSRVAVENIRYSGENIVADLYPVAREVSYVKFDLLGKNDLNNYLAPGEELGLLIELENNGHPVDWISAVLSTHDPDVSILDSLGSYDSVGQDSHIKNVDDAFRIQVSPDAETHKIKFFMDIETSNGAAPRIEFGLPMEKHQIMLVDDSGDQVDADGIPILDYYTHALDQLDNVSYNVWSVQQLENPTRYDMWEYDVIIWFTGTKEYTLSWPEMANFRNVLYLGGKVFLSGFYYGQHLLSEAHVYYREFFENWMHARLTGPVNIVSDSVSIGGIPGNDISGSFNYIGFNPDPTITNPVVIGPDSMAQPVFTYRDHNGPQGYAAISCDVGYKLVYCAFGLEALNNADRTMVMSLVLDWLRNDDDISAVENGPGEIDNGSRKFELLGNYPNPFNNTTSIKFELFTPGQLSLKIYDISGRKVCTLAETLARAGSYNLKWSGTDDLGNRVASGIYFCKIEAAGSVAIKKMTLIK